MPFADAVGAMQRVLRRRCAAMSRSEATPPDRRGRKAGPVACRMPMEPVTPSIGWGVLHLFYRVDRRRAEQDPGAAKRIVDAVASLEADGHQALVFAVLGHKADLGVMALGPDLARLQAFQQELLAGPLLPDYSFVSLTELSEYTATEDDERARLRDEEGLTDPAEVEERLAAWRERIAHYRENRLHPQLPSARSSASTRCRSAADGDDNWYRLPFDGAQGAHGRPRARRSHLRRPGAAADHRLDRARRLGVGRHAARRRPGRAEGDRERDALRRGVAALRRVRAVLHRARCSSRPTRCERVGLGRSESSG